MHPNERPELKSCPFCGGSPMEYVKDSYHIIKCSSRANIYAGCGAEIKRALLPMGEWELAVVANREAWNKRV